MALPAAEVERIFALTAPRPGVAGGTVAMRLTPQAAIACLWADALGDLEYARRAAEALAAGYDRPVTPRAAMLRARMSERVECSMVPTPKYISDATGSKTTPAPTAPASPKTGDGWVDSANGNKQYVWDGTTWTLGSVSTGQIEPNAVTAKHLVVSDNTNLVGNPSGKQGMDGWTDMAGSGKAAVFGATAEYYLYQTGRFAQCGGWFPVAPGDQFFCSFVSVPTGGTTPDYNVSLGLWLRTTDPDTATGESYAAGAVRTTAQSGVITATGAVTVGAGYRWAKVWTVYDHFSTGAGIYCKEFQVRRKTGNDGITTIDGGKITTGTIDAARINAINITADNATIGNTRLDRAWFARTQIVTANYLSYTGAGGWVMTSGLYQALSGAALSFAATPWDSTNRRLTVRLAGYGTLGFTGIQILGAVRVDSLGSGGYELRPFSTGVSGADLVMTLELWQSYYDGANNVRGKADWVGLGSSTPAFDVSVVAFSSSVSWL